MKREFLLTILIRFLSVLLINICLELQAVTLTNSFTASGVGAAVNWIGGTAYPDGYASFSYSVRPVALPGYGFDPSLGSLNSITVTLGSALTVSDSATYHAVGQSTGNGMYSDIISGAVQIIDYNGTNGGGALVSVDLTNGVNWDSFVLPTNGFASGSFTISNLQTLTITNPTIVGAFVLNPGTQSYNFELIDNMISGVDTYLAEGSPSAVAQFTSTIIYDYTPAPPVLGIQAMTDGLLLYWPASPANFRLQQSADLNAANWLPNTNTVNVVNGTNQVTISGTEGNLYFRLIYP